MNTKKVSTNCVLNEEKISNVITIQKSKLKAGGRFRIVKETSPFFPVFSPFLSNREKNWKRRNKLDERRNKLDVIKLDERFPNFKQKEY